MSRLAPDASHRAGAVPISLPGKSRKRPVKPGYIRRLASRADNLGELLGAEHDLVLLAQAISASETRPGRRTQRILLKRIERRRERLQRRALRDGARLYKPGPKKLVQRVRAAYAREAGA